ncbi:MAG: choice-of-anchor D domain-containing protein, partial [Candidatus Cloacimonetes bacterium]|nr:choice-of-anchor D domain-containing protein [Candidatus Cloacimonadota bacterium]
MKKYLFLLMMLGFLLPVFAGIYTIGTGTSGAALAPYNGLYDYGWSKVIYTLDELNAAGLIGENQIVGIGFYVVNTPVNYEMDSQHIYVRHSDVTSYLGDNLVHPDSELFQNVFEGTITYNGSGWFYISFFEPFNWNGVQGLEFLFENRDGSYVSSQPTFAYTNTNPNYTMVYKQQDNSFPQGTSGTRSYNRPNIMIYTPLTDPPYAATLIAPADGATLVNTDSILSWDSVFGADGYKVYFGTNPSPPFVADVGIETTFNPAALENGTTYYWQIVPYNDFGNAGNCPIWSFTVVPEALVTIGDGTVSQSLPVNAYYGYTYSQSIYLQSEINIPNKRIEKIYYHWNGAGVGNNSNEWLVYMGHTDVNNFPNGTSWIPLSELTQVYAGTLEIPAVNGWIEIALDLPFIYNNEQNLVIAVDENKPGYDGSAQYFYCTDSSPYYRSLRYYTDNPNPDPASPPSGSYLTYYPNIKLQFGDLPDYPIFSYRPQSIDFGQSIHGSPSAPQNVTISNTGAGMLYLEPGNISLIGDFAAEFSFSTANLPVALAMGQSVDIPVSVVPYTVGEIGAALSIMYDGEEYLVELSAEGLPPGLAIIGNGDANQSLPINPYYGYNYSQSIYLQSEINIPDKRIEKLYYYWNGAGVGTNSNEWLVYMGHTERNAFSSSSDWVPLIELTPVFNGTLDILAEAGWIEITLDVPFAYNNMQNLVIAVDENKPGYDGSGRYFYCTPSPQNRSLRYYNDNTNPDPASVPAGTLVGAYPNIMLLLGDVPDTPVLSYQPNSIDFGRVFQGILSEAQSLVISNVGGGYLNLSSENISIIGENAADFIFATNNLPITLGSGESVVITVNVMPTTEDSLSATLRISYADEYYDVELSAIAFPAGANVIGNGEITTRYPMGAYFGYERSAALYKANELGAGNKRINTLGWYATLPMNIAVPTKIYLKTCAENYMNVTHLWSEFIEGATLVFDQDVLSITANDWNTFTLENTFDLYDGENFLVLVERNYGGSGSSYGSTFPGIYGTTMPSMHQVIQTDNSPPTGYSSTMTERPNLLFIAESFESTDAPSPAYLVAPANGATKVDAIPTLSWTPGSGTPTGYKLYLGTSNPPEYL